MRKISILVFISMVASATFGQEASEKKVPDFTVGYIPQVTFWGAGVVTKIDAFQFFPNVKSTVWLDGFGAYKTGVFYHDPVTNNALSSAIVADSLYQYTTALWFAGLVQGVVPQPTLQDSAGRGWETSDVVSAFAFYRGGWLNNFNLGQNLASSTIPDRSGYLATSFAGGIYYNGVSKSDLHGLKEGLYAEVFTEVGPRALQSVAVDFSRVSANVRAYVPIYDVAPTQKESLFSVLFGVYAAVDQLYGNQIPFTVLQTIGGFWQNGSVGGTVRGTETGRFDGTFKAVANAELRFQLPGIYLKEYGPLYPGVVTYFDAGAWSGLKGLDPGAVYSTGVGVYFNIFDNVQFIVYKDFWLNGTPYDGSTFIWHANLGLQF